MHHLVLNFRMVSVDLDPADLVAVVVVLLVVSVPVAKYSSKLEVDTHTMYHLHDVPLTMDLTDLVSALP